MFDKLQPPFKSKRNQWYTANLFYERWVEMPQEDRTIDPQFTLLGGRDDLIDCPQTFNALADPTGYAWAMKYLGSWEHWNRLMDQKAPWFREAVERWVSELKIRLKQEAIQKVREISQGGSPQALQAAKYIAGAEWEKTLNGRGRPSKEVLSGELKRAVQTLSEEQEDMKRIGLTVVTGGRS